MPTSATESTGASETIEATEEATEEATPSVEPSEAAPAFEPILLKGSGPKVEKFTIPEGTAAIATLKHRGDANFIVHAISADGEDIGGLVNEIGTYDGTVLFNLDPDLHTAAFEVEADGAWTVIVKPVTEADAWDPAAPLEGKGDSVYLVDPPSSGLVTLDLTHDGDANFIVHSYSPDGGEGLVNEIGPFTGQVLLPDGTFLLEVLANGGNWTMSAG